MKRITLEERQFISGWQYHEHDTPPSAGLIVRALLSNPSNLHTGLIRWWFHDLGVRNAIQRPASFHWEDLPGGGGRRGVSEGGQVMNPNYERAVALLARYRSFCRYMREGRHRWTEVEGSRIYWMDNSETIDEVSQHTGETRRVTVKAPGGDVCF